MVSNKLTNYSKIYMVLDISKFYEKKIPIKDLVKLMPKERILKFNGIAKKSDKTNYLFSYFLLWYVLEKNKILTKAPKFFYTKNNKPYLKSVDGVFFSNSHTKNAIVCGISLESIGVDIEQIKDVSLNLVKKVCVDLEYLKYLSSNNKNEAFFNFWTKKESFCKLNDRSIFLSFSKINSQTLNNSFSFKLENFITSFSFKDKTKFIIKNLNFLDVLNFSLTKLKRLVWKILNKYLKLLHKK